MLVGRNFVGAGSLTDFTFPEKDCPFVEAKP